MIDDVALFMLHEQETCQVGPCYIASKKRKQDTFNVGKCDNIFNELLSIGKIGLSHAISPIEELKNHAYCKWYNSY
jgi:hypothetical protein